MVILKYNVWIVLMIIASVSCEKGDFSWDLPRVNSSDSLQNENPNNPLWPVANFMASNTNVPVGSSVSFISTSTQNPTSLNWRFQGGNLSFSNDSSPTVLYDSIGKYDVSLRVANNYGIDSITKESYIEVYYLKSFSNDSWDGWSNNGWSFSTSPQCPDCIYSYSSTPTSQTISKLFNNVPSNANLEFYHYNYSPNTTIKVKVNGVEIWSKSGFGENTISLQLPNVSNFTLTFEALIGEAATIYLNDIKIRP